MVRPPRFLCLSFACSSGPGCLVTVFWPLLLLLCGVSGAAFCRLGLLSPLSFCCSRLGFFLWRLFRLGWKAAVLSWFLPSLGGSSPSLALVVFAWQFLLFGCPSSFNFLDLFAGVLSSHFQCLLMLGVLPR